jgi:tetratricopeptide (TPR) repeat protein
VSDNPDRLIDDIAQAILDGTPIDWPEIDGAADETHRELIGELRLLSAVAELHRSDPDQPAAVTGQSLGSPGKMWGHLELLERIGGGTFGEVYRAWDTRLDREVAVKLLPADRADDPHVVSIIREGRLLAKVRHPGVVTIYDAQQIGDSVGLWMEFIRGRTLEQQLQEDGRCDPAAAVDIGIELCRAVTAVHDVGLLHRDIKTQNVVRASDGRLVLMDFGIGRELADGSISDLAGTPLYLAPEIFRGRSATMRTDVYSIGVVLFHMLTGTYPVQAAFVSDLRRAHDRGDARPIRSVRPDLPAGLAAAIDRALDPVLERRYGTAATLAHDLEALKPQSHAALKRLATAAAIVLACAAVFSINHAWLGRSRVSQAGPTAFIAPQGWLLVGAFTGTTGDGDLEATLRQAVTGELEESSYLNVFPVTRLRESLEKMERPVTTNIDEQLGVEICKREGLDALVTGSINSEDGLYVVSLRAMHVATGRVLAMAPESRRTREEALNAALGQSRRMRQLLGESVSSIQSISAPLEPVTSKSFEAVRHFTLGKGLYDQERAQDALPHFLQATALDPDFAMAHVYAGLSYGYLGQFENRRQAYEAAAALAQSNESRLGPFEREKILADYHTFFERFHEAAAHQRAMLNLRPGDGRVLANLGLSYGAIREHQQSIAALEAAWQAYPHPRVRWMLADMYSAAGHPGRAATLLSQYLDEPFDWIAYAKHLLIAGRSDDARAALDEAERRSNRGGYISWPDLALGKADYLRSEGRYQEAELALRAGLDRGGPPGVERLELAMASLLVDAGRKRDAIAHLRKIKVELARNRIVRGVLAARAGDLSTADAVLQQLILDARERQAPRPEARLEQLRAEIALARHQPSSALDHAVRAARTFTSPWTLVTLARAQTAAGRVPDAVVTWTSILERSGERVIDADAPANSQVVLAHLEIARLLERAESLDAARDHYDRFLRSWERADKGLAPLTLAREGRLRLAPARGSTKP